LAERRRFCRIISHDTLVVGRWVGKGGDLGDLFFRISSAGGQECPLSLRGG
jgi:hypothetical protein